MKPTSAKPQIETKTTAQGEKENLYEMKAAQMQ